MKWIMKHKLAEQCEAELWKIIYEYRGKGLSYGVLDLIVSQVIKSGVNELKDIESDMDEADKDSATWDN